MCLLGVTDLSGYAWFHIVNLSWCVGLKIVHKIYHRGVVRMKERTFSVRYISILIHISVFIMVEYIIMCYHKCLIRT